MLLLAGLEQASEFGLRQGLIIHPGDASPLLPPVRLALILRGLAIAAGMVALAIPMADRLKLPGAYSLVFVLALVPALRGAESLTQILAQKNLQTGGIALITLASAAVALAVAVGLAYTRPSGFALAWSAVAAAGTSLILSFACYPGQSWRSASVDWSQIRHLRSHSAWMIATGIASYLFIRAGDWLVALRLGGASLSQYQMWYMLGTLVPFEIAAVIWTVGFPLLCRTEPQARSDGGSSVWRHLLSISCILGVAWTLVVYSGGRNLLVELMGAKWAMSDGLGLPMSVLGAWVIVGAAVNGLAMRAGAMHLWTFMVLGMCGAVFAAAQLPWIANAEAVAWTLAGTYALGNVFVVTMLGKLGLVRPGAALALLMSHAVAGACAGRAAAWVVATAGRDPLAEGPAQALARILISLSLYAGILLSMRRIVRRTASVDLIPEPLWGLVLERVRSWRGGRK